MKKSDLRAELTRLDDNAGWWFDRFIREYDKHTVTLLAESGCEGDIRLLSARVDTLNAEGDTLRAELTELADARDQWHEKYQEAWDQVVTEATERDAFLRELRDEEAVNDDLRAELTELDDARDRDADVTQAAFFEIQRLERVNDDLRAYATEAYEHGVSDGIDMGKDYVNVEQYNAGYETGRDDGYRDGVSEYNRAHDLDYHEGYEAGFETGKGEYDTRRGQDFKIANELLEVSERLRGDW